VDGVDLPHGTVDPSRAASLDDAEQPVAHLGSTPVARDPRIPEVGDLAAGSEAPPWCESVRDGDVCLSYLNSPTAREMTRAMVTREIADWVSMAILAHRARGRVSVGLNAEALVKER
jgi:hypothetical protein